MNILRTYLNADVPVYLVGPPGAGKTATVYALADAIGMPVITILGALEPPEDVGGIPIADPNDGTFRKLIPAWFMLASQAPHLLFFDELDKSPQGTRNALLRIIAERALYCHRLHPGTRIVCAGNPPAAGGDDVLSAPMANRLAHVTFQPQVLDWVEWAKKAEIHPSIIDLVRHDDIICCYPETVAEASGPWPSPRSWHLASKLIAASDTTDPETLRDLVGSVVGNRYATAWVRRYLGAPGAIDPVEVLRTMAIPPNPDAALATLRSVLEHGKIQYIDLPKVFQYLERLLEAGYGSMIEAMARPGASGKSALSLGYTGVFSPDLRACIARGSKSKP